MNRTFLLSISIRLSYLVFLTIVFWSGVNAIAQPPAIKPSQQEPEQSAADLLGAGSRDLQPAIELGGW